MLRKVVFMFIMLSLGGVCFADAEHCPYDSGEAYNGSWSFKEPLLVSKESLLYVGFGKNRYLPRISVICIYRSGNWLWKTMREKFAEPVSGNWIKTIAPEETWEDYYGYFCKNPNILDCVWNAS